MTISNGKTKYTVQLRYKYESRVQLEQCTSTIMLLLLSTNIRI